VAPTRADSTASSGSAPPIEGQTSTAQSRGSPATRTASRTSPVRSKRSPRRPSPPVAQGTSHDATPSRAGGRGWVAAGRNPSSAGGPRPGRGDREPSVRIQCSCGRSRESCHAPRDWLKAMALDGSRCGGLIRRITNPIGVPPVSPKPFSGKALRHGLGTTRGTRWIPFLSPPRNPSKAKAIFWSYPRRIEDCAAVQHGESPSRLTTPPA
jgi:hypothetical protein